MGEQGKRGFEGRDRRESPQLRELFDEACRVTASLFDAHESLGGYANLGVYVQRAIHDAFPDLTMQEVALLASGVSGFHQARLEKMPR